MGTNYYWEYFKASAGNQSPAAPKYVPKRTNKQNGPDLGVQPACMGNGFASAPTDYAA